MPATAERKITLSDEQVRLLERFSREFRERHIEARRTGDLVAVDISFVGSLEGVGKTPAPGLTRGLPAGRHRLPLALRLGQAQPQQDAGHRRAPDQHRRAAALRSEEHTSELQTLMRTA